MNKKATLLLTASVALALATSGNLYAAVDNADAEKLLKDSKCLKCHDVEKTKKGKPYKKIAAEYKGKASAKAELIKHVTEPNQVEVEGEKVDHGTVKTRDAERINNLIDWILAR
ncbi:c-type cytochrome [Ferribacterium limneticum]|uniref:c-type cytochrome n=1 Tax=Ferribacterium limneticum TaxID=76259 RepID=UPI001CF8846E|nr:c-type cytochrome [Ferribacterium limneticum]UCV22755.1 class I cytochrome c [Ferribacterium limneticum]